MLTILAWKLISFHYNQHQTEVCTKIITRVSECFSKTINYQQSFQARINLYSGGKTDVTLTFKAKNSDNFSWFAWENLQTSPWTDMSEKPKHAFKLDGFLYEKKYRAFYIRGQHDYCRDDSGWFSIGNTRCCEWEKRHGNTSFLYGKTGQVIWPKGKLFVVVIRQLHLAGHMLHRV